MTTVAAVCQFLDEFAPARLAEDWDNVGLLVGDPTRDVKRIMTCLTVTADSAEEAVRDRADLIVAHHPLPFRPFKRLTTETTAGRLLLRLIRADVAVASPHTAFDSARFGINRRLAEGLELEDIRPLQVVDSEQPDVGTGRSGIIRGRVTLEEFADRVKRLLNIDRLAIVGSRTRPVTRVGIACGSGGSLMEAARQGQCDLFLTGETNFHTCLEAEANNLAMILTGHFPSERFAVEQLAGVMRERFPHIDVWPSRIERDPLQCI